MDLLQGARQLARLRQFRTKSGHRVRRGKANEDAEKGNPIRESRMRYAMRTASNGLGIARFLDKCSLHSHPTMSDADLIQVPAENASGALQCAYFDDYRCRSCSELPRPYQEQLDTKQAVAEATLAPFAPQSWLPAVASVTSGFRNKAKMVIGGSLSAPTLGVLDGGGLGVDLMGCALYSQAMQAAFPIIRDTLVAAKVPPYDVRSRRGEGKYVLLTQAPGTGELMLRFVLRSTEAIERIRKQLATLQTRLPELRVVSVNLLPEHKAVVEGETEIV